MKIDKNIPIPGKIGATKYPFREMDVGDSFEVSRENLTAVRNAAGQAGLRLGRKYSVKAFNGSHRCWRVE